MHSNLTVQESEFNLFKMTHVNIVYKMSVMENRILLSFNIKIKTFSDKLVMDERHYHFPSCGQFVTIFMFLNSKLPLHPE